MTPGRDPRDFISDLVVEPDGYAVRAAQAHSRDKLGILRYYLPAFTRACAKWRDGPYFVDACAGPGVYEFDDSADLLRGSSLIALGTGRDLPPVRGNSPDRPVQKVIALEKGLRLSNALRERVARYGTAAVIERGDCNVDLIPLMAKELKRNWPLLVFLDPEAFEVEWMTVEEVARFRQDQLTEMLILVNPTAVLRVLAAPQADRWRMLRAFPSGSRAELDEIGFERSAGRIEPAEAKRRIVEGYVEGLRSLGYEDPFFREITHPGKVATVPGGEVYTLVFGTASRAGITIMESAFDRMYTNQPAPLQRAIQSSMFDPPDAPRLPGARRPRS